MMGRETPLPQPQPRRSKSLDDVFDEYDKPDTVPNRGIEANKSSTDDSLFGTFVKHRQEVVVDFDEELRLQREKKKKSNGSKNGRRKGRRSRSPNHSPGPVHSTLCTAKPSARESLKSPSTSTSTRKSRLLSPTSGKSSKNHVHKPSPGRERIKSPRLDGTKSTPSRSSRHRKKVASEKKSLGELANLPLSPRSNPQPDIDAKDDLASIPSLVDDCLIRGDLGGHRGGTQWNILEDTPAGHAEEPLVIVEAIEYDDDDDESDESEDSYSDYLEEDEEILLEDDDDDDMAEELEMSEHTDSHERAAMRRNSLPSDPASTAATSSNSHTGTSRFDPSFRNHEMWVNEEDIDAKQINRFNSSGSVSLLSENPLVEDLDTVSELGNSAILDLMEENLMGPEDSDTEGFEEEGGGVATPATAKRSGAQCAPQVGAVPSLDHDSDESEGDSHPLSVPEDGPLDGSSGRRPRRKLKKSSSRHSAGRRSNSTTKSSRRRAGSRGRQDAMRGKKNQVVPDVVPTTPGVADATVRSPMSSSFTSTPNSSSLISSVRAQQQQQSLQALRERNSKHMSPPRFRASTPLSLQMGQDPDPSQNSGEDDDSTIGASTITTNFSTTQRTFGDNTVSTRSLFQSERMSFSETLRIPQRRPADSDSEHVSDHENGAGKISPRPPRSSSGPRQVPRFPGVPRPNPDHPLNRMGADANCAQGAEPFRTVLRKPSSDSVDLLGDDTITGSSGAISRETSGSSESLRWRKEDYKDSILPKAPVRKIGGGHQPRI